MRGPCVDNDIVVAVAVFFRVDWIVTLKNPSKNYSSSVTCFALLFVTMVNLQMNLGSIRSFTSFFFIVRK